ncbi:MAG TPA: sulfatase [Planctomycetaceae bacterium]|nr:sulfatase [Planctomycetaceae bacterium]
MVVAASLLIVSSNGTVAQSPDTKANVKAAAKPNVLWISSEDHGQEMGCYGDRFATTPNVDALARRGLLYRNVWSNAPVCAPARTTIITGMYPTSLGAEHMRSMVPLPPGIELFTESLRQAGYYCTNNSKEDYNVRTPQGLWDESSRLAHYKNRDQGQSFFAVFNSTLSHESSIRNFKGNPTHNPAEVTVPSFHPDHPTVRRDWAIYYDTVTKVDAVAGKLLDELQAAGLSESTIVFYWGDHGSGMPRHKRWPSDSGLRVPLVVYIPEAFAHLRPDDYQVGGETDRPVSFVDLAPTMLSLAGIEPPQWMQGHAFLGPYATPKQPYLYGFRGRMDERLDLVRSVTDGRYVYIKNYMPHLSQGQNVAYQMETPTTLVWRKLFDEGKLNAAQSHFWAEPKPSEEFYDLQSDPYEVKNLVESVDHAEKLNEMRAAHREHVFAIRDIGFVPEGERLVLAAERTPYQYGQDMRDYPLGKIFDVAQLASAIDDQTSETIAGLVKLAGDEHPVVRYWGTLGLRMRGEAAVKLSSDLLVQRLDDSSLAVQIVAAQSLALFGLQADRELAIARLKARADWSVNDVFTTMNAMVGLESLGVELASHADEIKKLPATGSAPHGRYDSYVPRLLANLKALVIASKSVD